MALSEQTETRSGPHAFDAEDVGLWEYIQVLWRQRWLVFGVTVSATFITFLMTLLAPRIFEATATVLAPKESESGLLGTVALSGLVQQFPGVGLSGMTANRDLFVAVLKSRSVRRAIVDRFGLQKRYNLLYPEDAIRKLTAATQILVSKEGVISVTVEDPDPYLAAEIANFYVEELRRVLARLGTSEASRQRAFLTAQVARTKAELARNETQLRRFQETNRAIVLPDQTRGAIEAAARLKAEIIAHETQLHTMRQFATDANPEVVIQRRRLEELKRHLNRVQYGDGAPQSTRGGDFHVPFTDVPRVGLELARLTREAKTHELVLALLQQQLEQARLIEAKESPSVQILDAAVAPERHVRPRLRVNVAVTALAALFLSALMAFGLEYKHARWRGRPSRKVPTSGAQ